jgi:GNAT superfamily N-acetyltransferase
MDRMHVRRAGVEDSEIVRGVRLRALLDAPDAFSSSYEREAQFPASVWVDRLSTATSVTLVCEDDDAGPQGMVTVVRDPSDVRVGWIVGMWLAPEWRGTGAGDGLVAGAVEWAASRVDVLRLHVMEGNRHAEHLYSRHDFSRTGASVIGAHDEIEIEMERRLV